MKKFLYEFISDHKIWQDIEFWERAITCKIVNFIIHFVEQIQKDLSSHHDMDDAAYEDSNERIMRFNETVFAILSSL
jgi:hypothetical protein